jgi:hypothetical protein
MPMLMGLFHYASLHSLNTYVHPHLNTAGRSKPYPNTYVPRYYAQGYIFKKLTTSICHVAISIDIETEIHIWTVLILFNHSPTLNSKPQLSLPNVSPSLNGQPFAHPIINCC